MTQSEIEEMLYQHNLKNWERRKQARCCVCGADNKAATHGKINWLQLTRDWQSYICYEHKHLDPTLPRDMDVTKSLEFDAGHEKVNNLRPPTAEEKVLWYKQTLEDGRWNLINVPTWLMDAVKQYEEMIAPEQLTLF